MRFKEKRSRREKFFLEEKKRWSSELNFQDSKNRKMGKIDSIEELFANLSADIVDEMDKNQVEVCVDCGEVFKTTYEYRGTVPRCSECGKILTSMRKEFVSKFRAWVKEN